MIRLAMEKRRLVPAEIGLEVTNRRKSLGWSQETLAAEAHIVARTVQRVEAGAGGDDSTLKRLARALKLNDGVFTDEIEIRTPEEREHQAKLQQEEMLAHNFLVPATELADGIQLMDQLVAIHAWSYTSEGLSPAALDLATSLFDFVNDLMTFGPSDLGPSERLDMARTMTSEYFKPLQETGFKVVGGRFRVRLMSGAGKDRWSALHIAIMGHVPETFLIPKDTKFDLG